MLSVLSQSADGFGLLLVIKDQDGPAVSAAGEGKRHKSLPSRLLVYRVWRGRRKYVGHSGM